MEVPRIKKYLSESEYGIRSNAPTDFLTNTQPTVPQAQVSVISVSVKDLDLDETPPVVRSSLVTIVEENQSKNNASIMFHLWNSFFQILGGLAGKRRDIAFGVLALFGSFLSFSQAVAFSNCVP